jgi:Na+-driven multidrug efflux pump
MYAVVATAVRSMAIYPNSGRVKSPWVMTIAESPMLFIAMSLLRFLFSNGIWVGVIFRRRICISMQPCR